jgi:hypothetical protein
MPLDDFGNFFRVPPARQEHGRTMGIPNSLAEYITPLFIGKFGKCDEMLPKPDE